MTQLSFSARQELTKNNAQRTYFKEAGSPKDRLHQETLEAPFSLIKLSLRSSITDNFRPKMKKTFENS